MTQHYLVSFEPVKAHALSRGVQLVRGPGRLPRTKEGTRIGVSRNSRRSCVETRAHLQSSIDEQNAVHAELQVAHEDVLSINEELQSTNEELMTTKEELQAANRGALHLNDGLRQRNTELQTFSTDMSTLLETVDIPILMLGLRPQHPSVQSPGAGRVAPQTQDIGSPSTRFEAQCPWSALSRSSNARSRKESFRLARFRAGRAAGQARVWPHRTPDREIVGSVLALIDVDRIKQAMAAVASARDFSAATVETVQESAAGPR